MRITAIAPFDSANATHILSLVTVLRADLVILPGYRHNTPSLAQLRTALPEGAWAFLEQMDKGQASPALLSSSVVFKLPPQVFSQSPTMQQLSDLESCFARRTVEIGEHRVSFILCGEINAFQADGTTKSGIKLPFDILINPAHSVMGRWHILGRKLSSLSRRGVVVHVANNNRNSHSLTTDVRIYVGGMQVGERDGNEFATWCTYDVPLAVQ